MNRPQEDACDCDLLRSFVETQNGDAFSALMLRHGPMVLGLARRVVRDRQLAEDIFQATFLVLARKAKAIRGRESLAAWLHSVAFRLALRARKSRQRLVELQTPSRRRPVESDLLDELSAREYLAIIDEELDRLPEKYRLPFVLCHLEGLTQDEAAKRLNLCLGTVKGRLERGRRALRTRLARRGLALGASLAAWVPFQRSALAVSRPLFQSTCRAAVTGQPASKAVAGLASTEIQTMFLAKLRLVGAAVLGLALLGWGAAALLPAASSMPAPPSPEAVAAATGPGAPKDQGVDLHGDPLPKGGVMRLGTIQFRAAGAALALSPDGQTLVGLRGDKAISFWDVKTGQLKETRELGARQNSGSILSHDGRWIATASEGMLEVWDVDTGKLAHKVPCKERIEATALSRDGKYLAAVAGQQDYVVRVWRLADGTEILSKKVRSEGSNEYVAFTPDGTKLLAAFSSSEVGILCWDMANGRQLWQNRRQKTLGTLPSFSADGTKLLNALPPLDVASGSALVDEKLPELNWGDQVQALADGRTLLVASPAGVMIWDLQTGMEVRRLPGTGLEEIVAGADGKTVITNSGALQRYELATGKPLYADTFERGHCQEVLALAFSADGQRLASSGADGTVRLWDLDTGRPTQVWRAHEARRPVRLIRWAWAGARAIDMSPDGRFIASAGSEERVRVWDSATGKEVRSVALPPAHPGEADRTIYHLRLGVDAKQITAVYGAQGFYHSGEEPMSPMSDWRATWDLPGGNLAVEQALGAVGARQSSLALDGKTLVLTNKIIPLRALQEAKVLEGIGDFAHVPFALSPDGSLVANNITEVIDKLYRHAGVAIWETATGKIVARLKTEGWSGQLLFHPSNRFLAVNDLDGIHLWGIATGKKISTRKLPGRIRATTTPGTWSSCLAFAPGGKRMATGHVDGTILLWDVELPEAPAGRLDPQQIEALWADLRDADAAKAWRAVLRLADSPDTVVPMLGKRLKPFAAAPESVTGTLLADLGSDSYARRQAASKQLKELGLLAEKALRGKLSGNPTLELRQRMEPLLKALEQAPQPLSAEELRELRAIAVLARIDSPSAREILRALAAGVPSARLTERAQAALRR